ncbi:MAG: carbamoyltransferase C-terminal domain-containing protein, partial [Pseudomonadota bacterium]
LILQRSPIRIVVRSAKVSMPLILGVNAFHADAAASIVRDGRIVAAAEEERFRRVKHWMGFPSQAISWCLKEASATLSDVDCVAINSDPNTRWLRKTAYAVVNPSSLPLVLERWARRSERTSIAEQLSQSNLPGRFDGSIHFVEHHLAHLASAFYVSPFTESSVVSIDGFGDFASTAWGHGRGDRLAIDGRIDFPNSLGIFYQAITQFLGFHAYGDEYKVMGLAPYGQPTLEGRLRETLQILDNGRFKLSKRFFRHHLEPIAGDSNDGVPRFKQLFSSDLENLLGPARRPGEQLQGRHKDLACSAQKMYETALFNLLRMVHEKHGSHALALAGGCAMNSVANGKITRISPYRRIYVQAASGDAGGALGAALHVAMQNGEPARPLSEQFTPSTRTTRTSKHAGMDHAYLGPRASPDEIDQVLKRYAIELTGASCSVEQVMDERALCECVALRIAAGDVVGWFQGRMEWGPRALGNRSILCDPRDPGMTARLNLKIKRRESFRPFAPAILREHVAEWFEDDDDVPFMSQVFQVREHKRVLIPAVTHIDGSARLQTVHRQTNQRFWQLIHCFHVATGVPIVLNTSFNENEPIVCRPREALDCFLRTNMDLLVLENTVIRRRKQASG